MLDAWRARHGISEQATAELLNLLNPTLPQRVPSDMESEAAVQAALQIKAAQRGCALWRNNSGACIDQDGRMVRYGLANTSSKVNKVFKSSDLIGVGPGGKFMAVEVKAPGWRGARSEREIAQERFMSVVRGLGGIAMFAQSVGDVFDAT